MALFEDGGRLPDGPPGPGREGSSPSGRPGDLADELLRAQVEPPPLFSLDDGGGQWPPTPSPGRSHAVGFRPSPDHQFPPTARVRAVLREVAHARLGRSAVRVDRVLDTAAAEELTLKETITRIQGMSIRGVTPASLRGLAAELERVTSTLGSGADPSRTRGR